MTTPLPRLRGTARCRSWSLVTAVLLTSCALDRSQVLEAKDTMDLAVSESGTAAEPKLIVRGLSGHSALAVDGIETSIEGDALVMLVRLALFTRARGSFEHTLSIPSQVKVVKFGLDKTVIWKRLPGDQLR